jgi:hypothetical protein
VKKTFQNKKRRLRSVTVLSSFGGKHNKTNTIHSESTPVHLGTLQSKPT